MTIFKCLLTADILLLRLVMTSHNCQLSWKRNTLPLYMQHSEIASVRTCDGMISQWNTMWQDRVRNRSVVHRRPHRRPHRRAAQDCFNPHVIQPWTKVSVQSHKLETFTTWNLRTDEARAIFSAQAHFLGCICLNITLHWLFILAFLVSFVWLLSFVLPAAGNKLLFQSDIYAFPVQSLSTNKQKIHSLDCLENFDKQNSVFLQ